MEFINKYIDLKITANANIDSSFCLTTQEDNFIILTFGILANDCLFDLKDDSYKFKIKIDKKYVEKYNEELNLNIGKQTICCNNQGKLLEILHCKLEGIQRKIFLESHILFLLYQSQKDITKTQTHCDCCSTADRAVETDKIHKARKFILDNLSENITIPIIANIVGTNQCYLKKGFKEVYNQTIFEFIQENRMIKAKHLLQTDHPIITEIAHNLGYASLSSFSQAYKNYFGISPTQQTKNHFTNN
jgi:AraC-like DNA-binding protein